MNAKQTGAPYGCARLFVKNRPCAGSQRHRTRRPKSAIPTGQAVCVRSSDVIALCARRGRVACFFAAGSGIRETADMCRRAGTVKGGAGEEERSFFRSGMPGAMPNSSPKDLIEFCPNFGVHIIARDRPLHGMSLYFAQRGTVAVERSRSERDTDGAAGWSGRSARREKRSERKTMEQIYLIITYTLAGILGLCFGSFLNVLVYRLPRGMSIAMPPSHCVSCGARVRWYDNVPVLSYLLLRGRCRDCGGTHFAALSSGRACKLSVVDGQCRMVFPPRGRHGRGCLRRLFGAHRRLLYRS